MKGARNLAYSAGLVLFFAAAPLFAAGDIAFSADSMTGSAGKQNASARLSGNAEVVSGSFTVRSDDMELTGENYRFITARGNVRGEDSEKGFSFSASGMEYDRQKEFSTFLGSVAFSDTENGVEITAGRLSYDRGSETVLMQIDVVLQKDGMTCTAAFAIYRRGQSALELTGAPFVSNDGNEFRARRIFVDLDTEKITLEGAVRGSMADGSGPDAGEETGGEESGTAQEAAE